MKHELSAEFFGVRLRPVQREDAAFIVWLRNLDHAVGRVGDSATDVAGQQKWLENYFARAGDYYFIAETPVGIPVGTYGIYGVTGSVAESGRWIMIPGVPAALPSGFALAEIAFKRLKLSKLVGTTVATNTSVLSINRKFGWRQTRVETAAQIIGGQAVDLIHFELTPADWDEAQARLLPLAQLAEKQIRVWEINQRQDSEMPWIRTSTSASTASRE
jgi:RimJ/RimL family protein N-acetyltransferase